MSERISIRRRLLLVVGLGITLASALQAFIAYRLALAEVDMISDSHMVEMARAVYRSMPVNGIQVVPAPSSPTLLASEGSCFTLRVQRVAEPLGQAVDPGQRARRHFSTRQQGTQILRVLNVEAPGVQIEVTHDLAIRAGTARALAIHAILPVLLITPILLLCAWLGTSHALRPMRRTRDEIARRSGDDLKPLSTTGVPEEALPFVNEINTLFGRIENEFEARRNFVADVAHELRSPLAALSLQVQGLCRARTPEARALAHDRVMAGIARASRLVEQLLVLAREGVARPIESVTTLPQVARLAMSDVIAQAQARAIELGADLQENLPETMFAVRGDVEALRTLLRNLLDNAVKYTPAGGVVRIGLAREPDVLVLDVEDSGPGIEPEERERLFERFQRGRSGQDAGGSGLGLAIVRTIASNHGIRLELAQSDRLGGLTVRLHFPPISPPETPAAAQNLTV